VSSLDLAPRGVEERPEPLTGRRGPRWHQHLAEPQLPKLFARIAELSGRGVVEVEHPALGVAQHHPVGREQEEAAVQLIEQLTRSGAVLGGGLGHREQPPPQP
jgi:hypothetical protein